MMGSSCTVEMRRHWRRFAAVARKEWQQLRRDRLTLGLLLGVPLAQILLFGFAITLSPRHLPAAWVALPQPAVPGDAALDQQINQALLGRLRQGDVLQIADAPMDATLARAKLQRGELRLLLAWPARPSPYLLQGQALPLRLEADLSDPHAQALVAQLGDGLAHRLAQRLAQAQAEPLPLRLGGPLDLALELQGRYPLPGTAGAYLVPALSGVILTLTLTLMAALCVVREQERGTWDALRSTPLAAGHIVAGKLAPYAGLGLLLYALLQGLGAALFGTPWASPWLWGLALLFMLGQLGLGLALSLLARSQLQALQLGVFFYLPSILLSGFLFPFESMPAWARALGEALPLTHFLRALRAELFRGADAAQLLSLGLPILPFTALVLGLAWLGYRRRV
ncbi:ABC-2 type transport system permease protein [Paucibacter oligotrophus]|uniref:Transport permease protein n=1 Tax=Roseateles oligotrophus TaxID=1769250 RepID=A0A840L9D1_9BURK|nr:ABC transporter permease [Roseateles oligotrophus]MBB4843363.1 ABC-2 type transport system permease protein [Roseateles oligotrophus]